MSVTIMAVENVPPEGSRMFNLHCMQRIVGRSFDHTESTATLSSNEPVIAGPISEQIAS